jgi:hypothetical protein
MNAAYYRAIQTPTGWAVAHLTPGTTDLYTVDMPCPSQRAAEEEAAHLEIARQRQLQIERDQVALLGQRPFARHGVYA